MRRCIVAFTSSATIKPVFDAGSDHVLLQTSRGPAQRAQIQEVNFLPADVAQHVGMNVEADVGHVVQMLAGHEPDDFADGALRVMLGHSREGVGIHFFVAGQFGNVVQQARSASLNSGLVA